MRASSPTSSIYSSRNIRGIATPVCGLVRNDSFYFRAMQLQRGTRGRVPLKVIVWGLLGIADALLYNGFHFVHMLQHILGQGNLAPGTNQVVIRPTDIEIQVAVQVVR